MAALDTLITIIGPELPNKDKHLSEPISYVYPAYQLAAFGSYFRGALTVPFQESQRRQLDFSNIVIGGHVLKPEEFAAFNTLLSGAFTLDTVIDYFIECADLLLYVDNNTISNLIYMIYIKHSSLSNDNLKTLRCLFALKKFNLISYHPKMVEYIISIINKLSKGDRQKIQKYLWTEENSVIVKELISHYHFTLIR